MISWNGLSMLRSGLKNQTFAYKQMHQDLEDVQLTSTGDGCSYHGMDFGKIAILWPRNFSHCL